MMLKIFLMWYILLFLEPAAAGLPHEKAGEDLGGASFDKTDGLFFAAPTFSANVANAEKTTAAIEAAEESFENPAEIKIKKPKKAKKAKKNTYSGRGILGLRSMWEECNVEVLVGGRVLCGDISYLKNNIIRIKSGEKVYLIPLEKVDFIASKSDQNILPCTKENTTNPANLVEFD